jgi:chemotaxis protein histidine kinase CheA
LSSLDLFLPLMKVDLDQRLVTGVATAETPDRSGEICDYASSKPYFEKWSAEALAASGGKSLGAVRAMHGRVAAGKLTDIAFDDDGKRVVVAAKIVDDDEWRKVCEGVYTGFSQGGRYVKRWPDPDTSHTRYTAEPQEISLVDLPCLPDATFEVVKDGVVEKRAFAARADAGAEPPAPAEAAAILPREAAEPPAAKAAAAAEKPIAPAQSRAPADAAEALGKAAGALAEAAHKLERAADENARLRKALDEVSPALADLAQRMARLEAQPLPPKAALRTIAKSADGEMQSIGADEAIRRLAALPAAERALALTKLSLANPLRF